MGRKPVKILAGLAMVGATLVGCESSRSYQGQGNRVGGAGTVGSATPGGNFNHSGTVNRPTGTGSGGATQPMPLGQPGNQQPVVVRPNPPGSTTVGGGGSLGGSPYQNPPTVNERQPLNQPGWNSSNTPTIERPQPRGVTTSIPDSSATGPATNSRLSVPTPPITPTIEAPPIGSSIPPDSSTSRRIPDVSAPLPQGIPTPGGAGAPVSDPSPILPPPGQ